MRVLRPGKKEKLISLKTSDKKLAQEIEGQIRARFREASLTGITPYKTTAFIHDWLSLKEASISRSSYARYRTVLDKSEVFLAEFVHQTTSQHIERYKTWLLRERRKPRTIIVELQVLQDFFAASIRLGYAKSNPVDGIEKPKKPRSEVQPYSPKELEAIFSECRHRIDAARDERSRQAWSVYSEVFWCLHYTGMRISDVLSLKWDNINLAFACIQKVQEKTGKELNTRIPTQYRERLERLLQNGRSKSGNVYTNTEGSPLLYAHIDRAIRIVLKARGIQKKSPIHSFRHEYVLRMLNQGMPPHIVAAQIGDTVETIVRNYVKPQIATQEQIDNAYGYPQVSRKCPENIAEIAVLGQQRSICNSP